jgi:DNA-binding CsgD family transcriptional regulator
MDRGSKCPIALVEAAYDLQVGAAEWLPNLLRAGCPSLDLGQGCAATVWTGSTTDGEPLVSQLHAESEHSDLAMRFARAVQEVDPRLVRAARAPEQPGVYTLAEARRSHRVLHDALTQHVGCADMLALWAMGAEGHGVGIHVPSATTIELSRSARERWQMVSCHIAAAHRLRRRLSKTPSGTPVTQIPLDAEAVLDPKRFSVTATSGQAETKSALEAIRKTAIHIDRARGPLRRDETHNALRLWEEMVRGRWSVADWFDSDGRRFILALPNPPEARDPRGLTEREYQVAAQTGAGKSGKHIACDLGITRSQVSQLLRRAMRKLGCDNAGQLVMKVRTLLVDNPSTM